MGYYLCHNRTLLDVIVPEKNPRKFDEPTLDNRLTARASSEHGHIN